MSNKSGSRWSQYVAGDWCAEEVDFLSVFLGDMFLREDEEYEAAVCLEAEKSLSMAERTKTAALLM